MYASEDTREARYKGYPDPGRLFQEPKLSFFAVCGIPAERRAFHILIDKGVNV
jgi:hypothetical protein